MFWLKNKKIVFHYAFLIKVLRAFLNVHFINIFLVVVFLSIFVLCFSVRDNWDQITDFSDATKPKTSGGEEIPRIYGP